MRNSQGNAPIDGEPLAAAALFVIGWSVLALSAVALCWLLMVATSGSGVAAAEWVFGGAGVAGGALLIGFGSALSELRAIRRLLAASRTTELRAAHAALPDPATPKEDWK